MNKLNLEQFMVIGIFLLLKYMLEIFLNTNLQCSSVYCILYGKIKNMVLFVDKDLAKQGYFQYRKFTLIFMVLIFKRGSIYKDAKNQHT